MKNIWKIFQRDLQQIQKNVIAMIVIIGITVVPCLYAWFNIAASWDPYENTGNLKVAVASVDEGYEEVSFRSNSPSAIRYYLPSGKIRSWSGYLPQNSKP